VRIVVPRPAPHGRERPLGVSEEVRADASLGGEALGELDLGVEREVEVVEAALGHEHRVRQIEERLHPRTHELVGRVRGSQRTEEDRDRARIVRGQVGREGVGDPRRPREELQRLEIAGRVAHERALGERGLHLGDRPPDAADQRGREEVLERLGHRSSEGAAIRVAPQGGRGR
jgi:hypothetical protein